MVSTIGRLAPAILLSSLTLFALNSAYADATQMGRYLTVNNKPKLAQVDLLSQDFQVRFPSSVQTIGDAMEYLLRQSGYRLVPETKRSAALKISLLRRICG